MLRVTRGQQLTTAITGSYPRPLWYEVNLRGQSLLIGICFLDAARFTRSTMSDSMLMR